ncbi:VirB8/TrbF family protein [Massilia sp. PWRC2]|uniref:VirB8/TrbF family protein n=1 Tax=Massilia sp. PWRC2 TaxID=2804626 RepID=UPI003CE7D02E
MNLNEPIKQLLFRQSASDERRGGAAMEDGRRQGENANPFLAARRTWNDQSAANVASRQMFQLLGVLALLVALAGVGGVVYIGSQSKFIPYVVEVDRFGQRQAVAPADRAAPVDQRVVHAAVADWIGSMRLVTPDIALQRKAVFRVYAMLAANDPATAKTNEWLNGTQESSPFKRAAKETASIEITSVLPQTPDTWQVDWLETVRDRQGAKKGEAQRWRALVTVYATPTTPDTTDEDMRNNPLGIHVRDFSWSKQL